MGDPVVLNLTVRSGGLKRESDPSTQMVSVGWAVFLGFLVVALIIGAVSAGLILKGAHAVKELSLVPEKTVETLKEDKTWAQNKIH